jgi:hypothetical protein
LCCEKKNIFFILCCCMMHETKVSQIAPAMQFWYT